MKTLAQILVVFLLPAVLLLTNVQLVMSHAFIRYEYGKPDFPPAPTISDTERLPVALASVDFIRGRLPVTDFANLKVSGETAYNAREVQHMIDVRDVTQGAFLFWGVAGALVIAALFVLRGRRAARALLQGSLLTVGLLLLLGLFAAVSFDQFFTWFHAIFFEGDTWLFNYDDTLIQLFPLPLWFDASLIIVGLTIVQALVIGWLSWWMLRRAPRRRVRAYAR